MLDWKPEYLSYQTGLEATIRKMKEHRPFFE